MNNFSYKNTEDHILDLFDSMEIPSNNISLASKESSLEIRDYCFFHIKQLSHDLKYPHREAFENVISAIDNPCFNFVYVISGDPSGISLYVGCVANTKNKGNSLLKATEYSDSIENLLRSNFLGSEIEKLDPERLKNEIINPHTAYKSAGLIVGVPSVDKEKIQKGDDSDFQGMERLINCMMGSTWRLVVVAERISRQEIAEIRENVYSLYNQIQFISKVSLNKSLQNQGSFSNNYTKTKNWTKGGHKDRSEGSSSDVHNEYSSKGKNESSSGGESWNSGGSRSDGKTETISKSDQFGFSKEIVNKKAQCILDYIDNELIERLKYGLSKGLFNASVYYFAENPKILEKIRISIMSLFQSKGSSYSPLTAFSINYEDERIRNAINSYQSVFRLQFNDALSNEESMAYLLKSRISEGRICNLSTMLTSNELSLIASVPHKEVPGLLICESIDLGLNYDCCRDGVELGCLVQNGRVLPSKKFKLNKDVLNKHTFIAGTTGAGKTTTCHVLLKESKLPFLVIEPAKTEYRTLINIPEFEDVEVYTVGNEVAAPFHINPFEFVEGELLSSHIDMMNATFTSSFPMEGSMPQIIEEAIYLAYKKKGWNPQTNENLNYQNDENLNGKKGCRIKYIPRLTDFLTCLKEVVHSKNFSDRLQQDYEGTLISRFSNLLQGSKGCIFNCEESSDFSSMLDKKVVLEIETLKSPEDKSLFMGFILARMTEEIKRRHKNDLEFRHITLVEEAHRLLSKTEIGDSCCKRQAVTVFTDLLAEVRKYGECLIIVDQSPNDLASGVLKNTNTKIIHKIQVEEDQRAVGNTMCMDEKQCGFLPLLTPGNVVLFSEGMKKPIQVKVNKITDTNGVMVTDEEIRNRYVLKYPSLFIKNILSVAYFSRFVIDLHRVFNSKEFNIYELGKIFENIKCRLVKNLDSYINEICNKSDLLSIVNLRKNLLDELETAYLNNPKICMNAYTQVEFIRQLLSGEKSLDFNYDEIKIMVSSIKLSLKELVV